jgi:hypothetical protein
VIFFRRHFRHFRHYADFIFAAGFDFRQLTSSSIYAFVSRRFTSLTPILSLIFRFRSFSLFLRRRRHSSIAERHAFLHSPRAQMPQQLAPVFFTPLFSSPFFIITLSPCHFHYGFHYYLIIFA